MKSKSLLFILALTFFAIAAPFASAEIYRWTDAQGGEHFSMDLNSVPPRYRAAAKASAGQVGKSANINIFTPSEGQSPAAPSVPRRGSNPSAKRPSQPTKGDVERVEGQPESYWRAKVERYLRQIGTIETQIEACKDMRAPIKRKPGRSRSENYNRYQRERAAADACRAKKPALTEKHAQLENFLESARRKGVPPGWIRRY